MTSDVNPCQAFFEQHAQTENKAKELIKTGKAIEWEALSAASQSPHPVKDEEQVLRLVFSPFHIHQEDGSLKPSLFSDVKSRGGSVQRLDYARRDTVIETGRAIAEGKNSTAGGVAQTRGVFGTVNLPVEGVRKVFVSTTDRAFGVFDTAKQTDPSHADIFQIVPEGQGARSARIQLTILASEGFERA